MIYQNKYIEIIIEESEIPWLKIFTKDKNKEFSFCSQETKNEVYRCLDIIEKEMLLYFKPEKINIASFGNYEPRVHFHIMARFKEDSYFPEPMWGKKQRTSKLSILDFQKCWEKIVEVLKKEEINN